MSERRLFSTEAAAEYLSLSTSSFRTAVAPHCRKLHPVPGRVVWDRLDLDAWADGLSGRKPQLETVAPGVMPNPLDRFLT